jgi:hypothetical protein
MSPHESWYHYPDGHEVPADEAEVKREELETA